MSTNLSDAELTILGIVVGIDDTEPGPVQFAHVVEKSGLAAKEVTRGVNLMEKRGLFQTRDHSLSGEPGSIFNVTNQARAIVRG